ncbi:MAG: S1 RNA-binding domain-containing protein [bacterium]|nr:S1 RNA-binding domain-containing protein [bacterium]
MAISLQKTKEETPIAQTEMGKLLEEQGLLKIPQMGDIVDGEVLSVSKNEVHVDIEGLNTGMVRGRELFDESGEYTDLKVGEKVQATVMELENEKGVLELSFRQAGHKKAWDRLTALMEEESIVEAEIVEANRGGLMIKVGRVMGFLPVSQLTVEHYPRVEGGDKDKILERLQRFIGSAFKVRVIDVEESDEKLIVSEKQAWEEKQKEALQQYKVGNEVEGKVTGVVDFGAFVEFGEGLEGLVHISELAWQRIDDPRTIINVGDEVKARIISLDQSRISLSMKQLMDDPWKEAMKRYTVGQVVEGKVLKLNPFGAFVELDEDIHGLAHISELSHKLVHHPGEIVKEGETKKFKILSIDPSHHRLGLSLKALEKKSGEEKDKAKEATESAASAETVAGAEAGKEPSESSQE